MLSKSTVALRLGEIVLYSVQSKVTMVTAGGVVPLGEKKPSLSGPCVGLWKEPLPPYWAGAHCGEPAVGGGGAGSLPRGGCSLYRTCAGAGAF